MTGELRWLSVAQLRELRREILAAQGEPVEAGQQRVMVMPPEVALGLVSDALVIRGLEEGKGGERVDGVDGVDRVDIEGHGLTGWDGTAIAVG